MILVRIEGISGNCQVRGYEEFFPVDSFDMGAESAMDSKGSSDSGGGRDMIIKKNREPEEVTISRKIDAVSPTLMSLAIKNRTLGESIFCTIDVSFVQWRATEGSSTDCKAYFLLRFGGARLVSWKVQGSDKDRPTETIDFKYKQVAVQYRATTDGITYAPTGTQTWDFEKNAPCDNLVPPEWRKGGAGSPK